VIKRLLLIGALALAIGAAVRSLNVPVVAGSSLLPPLSLWSNMGISAPQQRWEPVWAVPVTDLVDMALAPNGSSVAWIDSKGTIRRIWGEDGRMLWETPPYSGLNRVLLNRQGVVIGYSMGQGERSSLRFLHPELGASRTALIPLRGAIQAATLTMDGSTALIGTNSGQLYTIPVRSDSAWAGTPRLLSEIPLSLDVQADPQSQPIVYCGTQSTIAAWKLLPQEQNLWQTPALPIRETGQSSQISEVIAAESGDALVRLTTVGVERTRPQITFLEASTGRQKWTQSLNGTNPRVKLSANGRFVAVTYSHRPNPKSIIVERKVAVFDHNGRRLFQDRGGISFSPELVAISAEGTCITVRDTQSNLWMLDNQGRTLARLRPPQDSTGNTLGLARAVASRDGAYLLLHYTGKDNDQRLAFYRFQTTERKP